MELAFLSPSPMELAVIAVIALIVLGPSRLPDAARSLGKGMREMRDSFQGNNDQDDDDDDEYDDDEDRLLREQQEEDDFDYDDDDDPELESDSEGPPPKPEPSRA